MQIQIDDLSGAAILELLREHLREMHSTSPPESTHALDLDGLRRPEVTLWSAMEGGQLVGCAALQGMGDGHAEIKSMRTARDHQQRGVASRLLEHLVTEARGRGLSRLSLETGSSEFFAPARGLYEKHGFTYCGPFGDYREDPHSVFMTKAL